MEIFTVMAFNNIQSVDDINSFGDDDVFKAIDSEEDKLKSSIEEIETIFKISQII